MNGAEAGGPRTHKRLKSPMPANHARSFAVRRSRPLHPVDLRAEVVLTVSAAKLTVRPSDGDNFGAACLARFTSAPALFARAFSRLHSISRPMPRAASAPAKS